MFKNVLLNKIPEGILSEISDEEFARIMRAEFGITRSFDLGISKEIVLETEVRRLTDYQAPFDRDNIFASSRNRNRVRQELLQGFFAHTSIVCYGVWSETHKGDETVSTGYIYSSRNLTEAVSEVRKPVKEGELTFYVNCAVDIVPVYAVNSRDRSLAIVKGIIEKA